MSITETRRQYSPSYAGEEYPMPNRLAQDKQEVQPRKRISLKKKYEELHQRHSCLEMKHAGTVDAFNKNVDKHKEDCEGYVETIKDARTKSSLDYREITNLKETVARLSDVIINRDKQIELLERNEAKYGEVEAAQSLVISDLRSKLEKSGDRNEVDSLKEELQNSEGTLQVLSEDKRRMCLLYEERLVVINGYKDDLESLQETVRQLKSYIQKEADLTQSNESLIEDLTKSVERKENQITSLLGLSDQKEQILLEMRKHNNMSHAVLTELGCDLPMEFSPGNFVAIATRIAALGNNRDRRD